MRLALILFAACAFGQQSNTTARNPLYAPGGVACSATVTANCVVKTDASGNAKIGTTVLDAAWGPLAPVTVSISGPVTVNKGGFWYNNSAGALTFNLPAITSGMVGFRACFANDDTRTGAITLQLPASTQMSKAGALGTAAGTLVSGGALDDNVCVVALTTTKYRAYVGSGTWTNN